MTWRAWRRNPGVATASPGAGRPAGSVFLSSRQAASSSGPAARWIAPSTPPPPSSPALAALTMASTRWVVMSPRTASRTGGGGGRPTPYDVLALPAPAGARGRTALSASELSGIDSTFAGVAPGSDHPPIPKEPHGPAADHQGAGG